uniref:PSP proline-rich domain-containing protein n=1 Tax=Romanomermis culicivorax TaxID=13658 RepID=A0A915IHX4_ROMCU
PKKIQDDKKTAESEASDQNAENKSSGRTEEDEHQSDEEDIEIEYVFDEKFQEEPLYKYFAKVFDAFQKAGKGETLVKTEDNEETKGGQMSKEMLEKIAPKAAIVERMIKEEEEAMKEKMKEMAEKPKMSKKKLRVMTRPTIAELKASINRPDVVEWHDVTAKDPKLLVYLKSLRNTVPVPRHWCFKRKYLAGKRGFEKPPFQLPEFIRKTGIMEMRQALQEKGKELESKMKDKKPGELSDDLRIALGMPVGPNAFRFPPPWLIAMQRYGPPPSYPNLKVAGLNAPIPEGCSFGYHAGGWGKPPVDENGRPLYGDVFGMEAAPAAKYRKNRHIFKGRKSLIKNLINAPDEEEIERKPWGELESEESSSEEEEEEEEQEADDTGLVTPAEGLVTPSGLSSGIPTGVETPDSIEFRKRKLQEEGVDTPATGSLYTILPEKRAVTSLDLIWFRSKNWKTSIVPRKLLSLTKKLYNFTDQSQSASGVEISLNPEELDLVGDSSGLQKKYEEGLRQQQSGKDEDFSDMVAEHAARQKRKRKAQEEKKQADTKKKLKDFKF